MMITVVNIIEHKIEISIFADLSVFFFELLLLLLLVRLSESFLKIIPTLTITCQFYQDSIGNDQ